jgi:hypothetical protein
MKKKMGPLPVWAWGLILGVGVFFLYERSKASSSTSSSVALPSSDLVDPATGLTYGQEQSAALNANATSPSQGALGSSTSTTPVIADQLNTLESLLGFIQGIDPNFGTGVPNVPNVSATTAAAAASPPIVNVTVSAPATTPTAHPAITASQSLANAISAALLTPQGLPNAGQFINVLLSKGAKLSTGNLSSGTLMSGGQKYFIFQQAGTTHIRQALPTAAKPPVVTKITTQPSSHHSSGGVGA